MERAPSDWEARVSQGSIGMESNEHGVLFQIPNPMGK